MKTIEDAAWEYAGCSNDVKLDCGHCHYYERQYECRHWRGKDAFEYGVEFAQQWISVEDDLPENSQEWHYEHNKSYKYYDMVLCKSKNNKIFVARRYIFMNKDIKWNVSSTSETSITHWRPIEFK